MSKIYMAVTVCQDKNHRTFMDRPSEDYSTGYFAYILPCEAGKNLKFALDCIGGLQVAHLCRTKKEAAELVTAWNDAYKANGKYLFDSPAL